MADTSMLDKIKGAAGTFSQAQDEATSLNKRAKDKIAAGEARPEDFQPPATPWERMYQKGKDFLGNVVSAAPKISMRK